jgi:hypothetical protein
MITQTLLFLLLHVVGISLGMGFGPARRVHLVGALGLLVGLAAIVVIELAMMSAGVVFTVTTGCIAVALVIAASWLRAWRRGALAPRALLVLAGWTLGFAAGSLAVASRNLSLLTYDSHYIVMMGLALSDDGGFAPGMLAKSGDYGSFMMLAQSLVGFTRASYLWALAPVFAASTAVAFGVLLREALDALHVRVRGRAAAIALLTAATFSAYMLFRHSFYIHTNFGTAAYLLVFCALFWLAEVERDTQILPLAFLSLAALALQRIEAPVVCTLFAALTVLPSRLPSRPLVLGTGAVALGTTAWYAVMASEMLPDSQFLTPMRCYALAGVLLVFSGYVALASWPRLRWLARVNRAMPAIVALACVAGLVAAFALRWTHMASSAQAWLTCLLLAPYWRGVWPVIAGFAVLGLLIPAPPERWVFVVGVPAYLAFILLLVWGREPYYYGIGDSASRMAIHLVPLALFYLGLKYIPLLRREEDHAPAEPAQPG